MSFEHDLEELIARGVQRGIIAGLQSLPLNLIQTPAQEAPKATRAPRKPKEEVPPVVVEPATFDAAHGLSPFPVVEAPTPVVAEAQAIVAASPVADSVELTPEQLKEKAAKERINVGRALMTIVKREGLGPNAAKEVLALHSAKVVDDLKPAQYLDVVNSAAKVLGITFDEAMALPATSN